MMMAPSKESPQAIWVSVRTVSIKPVMPKVWNYMPSTLCSQRVVEDT